LFADTWALAEAVTAEMHLGAQAQQEIYLIIGVKKTNLQTARTDGSLSAENVLMGDNLMNTIEQYSGHQRFYESDQVMVFNALWARLG